MKKQIFLAVIGIVLLFITPWLCIKFLQSYSTAIERKWTSYFNPRELNNISIVEFKMTKKKNNSVFLFDSDELDSLYNALCKKHTNRRDFNVKSLRCYTDYFCRFSDGERLKCQASFNVFQDRTYLSLFYPQDAIVFIQPEGELSEKTLEKLRSWLLEGEKTPPVFKEN